MPSDAYISEKTAREVAEKAVLMYEQWNEDYLIYYDVHLSLLGVTADTAKPDEEPALVGAEWHLKFVSKYATGGTELALKGMIPEGFKVTIDAVRGEVLDIHTFDRDEPFGSMME